VPFGEGQGHNNPSTARTAEALLQPGVRASLELPEAGTCVVEVGAVIRAVEGPVVSLRLLDELPPGLLDAGSRLELFLPRPDGIYHWLCALRSQSASQARAVLLSEPLFVQRRMRPRWRAELQADVRRVRSARRGTAHRMRVADLSRGGLKLEGPLQLSTGDTLEVTVDLGPEVQLVGRAVMAYPTSGSSWAAHVSFVEGQGDAVDLVDSYIVRHSSAK